LKPLDAGRLVSKFIHYSNNIDIPLSLFNHSVLYLICGDRSASGFDLRIFISVKINLELYLAYGVWSDGLRLDGGVGFSYISC
jgi:hypothetical protein